MTDKTALSRELALGRSAQLPLRNELPDEYKWKLCDIYSSLAEWEKDFSEVKESLSEIGKFRGTLGDGAENLAYFFALNDKIAIRLEKLFVFANMKSHEDTADSKWQGPSNRIAALSVEYSAAASFVTPELTALPEERLREYAKDSLLKDHAFGIRELLRRKAHVLTEAEEMIMARAGEMAGVADNAFSMLTNADMKFPSIKDKDGSEVEMSEERAVTYLRSEDRDVRRAAFDSLYTPYNDMKNTLGATFDGMLKSAKFNSSCRRYDSPLAAALDADNIPVSVYDNLVGTIESNLEPMHRYMDMRKKVLGLSELHYYDMYAPLVPEAFRDIPWSAAKEMMYRYLAPLGEEYIAQTKKGLEEGWADVFPNKGKRSGAYSWGSYATHPYIFMNYTNTINDVMTLVHEMGHSMHSFCSRKNQPYPTADYCIFTAEVASTTNEVLFLSGLISDTDDRAKLLSLLNGRLENIRTTVYRQTMFASFEREVHKRAADGGDTTPDGLKELWYDLNRKYYGKTLVIDEALKMEWARIPHFYTPFYVYQYATGFSAATALAGAILEKGHPAVEKYLSFLTKGGSDYPINLLRGAGVDMSTPEPVKAVVKQFTETLDEMEKLL
ncbi:MAG: oligoendopeptidase F [Synergistes sp.]|nr:oligoendopeptidase F [Synergistes sp.]